MKRFLKTREGYLLEVDVDEKQANQIAHDRVGLDTILEKLPELTGRWMTPVLQSMSQIKELVEIESMEAELNFGIEAGGSIFIAQGKTNASLSIRVRVVPNSK